MNEILTTEASRKIPVEISGRLEGKIRHLCEIFPSTEWSGVLFYRTFNKFDEDNFHILCEDFLLMDIGTGVTTEYKDSVDIATYMVEHPELLEEGVYEALAHSHHSMAILMVVM